LKKEEKKMKIRRLCLIKTNRGPVLDPDPDQHGNSDLFQFQYVIDRVERKFLIFAEIACEIGQKFSPKLKVDFSFNYKNGKSS
jgi:hypothetical protein